MPRLYPRCHTDEVMKGGTITVHICNTTPFDIDALDPIYAIGTGAPEPGGVSMRDAQVMLRGLRGLQLIGGDVCEMLPPLDPTGHTALNAANLMFEILCVVADAVAQRT